MLNKDKLSTVIGRRSRREAFTVAVAAVGLVAVAASSAVSFADDSVPERAAMVVEQAESIPAVGAAPAIQAIPAPAPMPEAAPAPAPEVAPAPMPEVAPKVYSNDLHGWITEALDIMAAKGIPGSYEGIHRNIMRESTGNPQAINLWDINAINGIPSKGLLQVIDPTFAAYHVEGTPFDVWNPVSNIVAACNYAANRYGSMDNVNSAY